MTKPLFICYSRVDEAFAKRLARKLVEVKQTPWRDVHDLVPGEQWVLSVDEAIRDSDAMIVVVTPASRASVNVTYEWAYALGLGLRVIPVLYKTSRMPPRLSHLHAVDLRSGRWVNLLRQIGKRSITNDTRESARMRAEFKLLNGQPYKLAGTDEYPIVLRIDNAPEWAQRVRYQVHDDGFDPAVWTSGHRELRFETSLSSYGDVLISADIRGPEEFLRIEDTLWNALRATYRRTRDRGIRAALTAIRDN